METFKIYRAMCKEEAVKTLKDQYPFFFRRFKYFSPHLNFVINRVQDGNFNNSKFSKDRYSYLLEFTIKEIKNAFYKGKKEWKLDRRKASLVKFKKVKLISIKN